MEISRALIEKLQAIPAKPGVYQMKDGEGNIIYIGKSKSLKSRVRSYFNTEHKWNKIKRMVYHIDDIDYIITDTHLEAQLLECTLIKELKPLYNSQFKNDRRYKYIKIVDTPGDKPIIITDERDDNNCFGPYRSKHILSEVINFFLCIYPISKKGSSYDFVYHILPKPIEQNSFKNNRDCLIEVFTTEEGLFEFLGELENRMKLSASEFKFELALTYKNIINYLTYLHRVDIKKPGHEKSERILLGEKLIEGYKIFYIVDDSIILKRKYQKLSKRALEAFVKEARRIESTITSRNSEKSRIDFKQIINAEIQDQLYKAVIPLNQDVNIGEFINELREKESPLS